MIDDNEFWQPRARDLFRGFITAAVIGMFIFGMINSYDCMDGLKANLDDLDEDEAEKTSEKFKAATWNLF